MTLEIVWDEVPIVVTNDDFSGEELLIIVMTSSSEKSMIERWLRLNI
jgi:hypothetical protein